MAAVKSSETRARTQCFDGRNLTSGQMACVAVGTDLDLPKTLCVEVVHQPVKGVLHTCLCLFCHDLAFNTSIVSIRLLTNFTSIGTKLFCPIFAIMSVYAALSKVQLCVVDVPECAHGSLGQLSDVWPIIIC